MQRRFKKDPQADLESYISMVIENLSIGKLNTEQVDRELSIFALTLLSAKVLPKSLAANSH